ncbi:hypothetical protein [Halorubrum sp. CBA1229]|uniref:hypothetical protein n=1 Tax=Halorubrum sp. CBA1229 TaxID=1853699 RepID=UPI0020D1E0D9|nr:hypothetical protein [Halorubrum sp. CBA1229]
MADEEGSSGFYGDAPAAGEDGTSTDSIDGGGGDRIIDSVTGSISSWGDLTLPDTLQSFLSNPQGFIVGAVATAILEQVFGIVTTLINLVFRVFGGSAPGRLNAPGETLGLIDVPVYVADLLVDVGTDTGNAILIAIESMNDPVFALASNAGPATPVIITAIVVGEVIVVLWILQRLVFVLADLLQLGGLTE